jgi:hypothetical protein
MEAVAAAAVVVVVVAVVAVEQEEEVARGERRVKARIPMRGWQRCVVPKVDKQMMMMKFNV